MPLPLAGVLEEAPVALEEEEPVAEPLEEGLEFDALDKGFWGGVVINE